MDLNPIFIAVRDYGLPLTMLVILFYLNIRGIYVAGREKLEVVKSYERLITESAADTAAQLKVAEERRLEERDAKLAAEKRLSENLTLLKDTLSIVTAIREDLDDRLPPTRAGR